MFKNFLIVLITRTIGSKKIRLIITIEDAKIRRNTDISMLIADSIKAISF